MGSEMEAENNLMHSSDVSQPPGKSFGFSFFLCSCHAGFLSLLLEVVADFGAYFDE